MKASERVKERAREVEALNGERERERERGVIEKKKVFFMFLKNALKKIIVFKKVKTTKSL